MVFFSTAQNGDDYPLDWRCIWDNIVERNAVPGPTEAQKAELDRRLLEHAANPDDVVPWSEVKDSALARIRQ
jgi:putative addiction module component (TIGR02574 family)